MQTGPFITMWLILDARSCINDSWLIHDCYSNCKIALVVAQVQEKFALVLYVSLCLMQAIHKLQYHLYIQVVLYLIPAASLFQLSYTYLAIDANQTVICVTIHFQSFIMFRTKVFVLFFLFVNSICLSFFFSLKNFKDSKVFGKISDRLESLWK